MLIPLVVDQMRDRARRRVAHRAVPRQAALPARVASFEVPEGIRYQLFRALRAMAKGQFMIVQRRLPALPVDAEGIAKCQAFLKTLRDAANWREGPDLEAVFVPGTAFPAITGPVLIRAGWCAPSEEPHHIPNLRAFFLTERGREMLGKAWLWWAELGYRERLRLMLTE
jgi:hypothetical protein